MVIEALAIAIGKTLTVHFLTLYLNVVPHQQIDIDGAPSWYYEESSNEIASFAHQEGGLESIETAKNSAKDKMSQKVQNVMENMLYDFYKVTRTPEEKILISKFKKDENLPLFTQKFITYPNIEYNDEKNLTFVKASILKEQLLEYERNRLQEIKIALQKKREQEAFKDLKNESEVYDVELTE